MEIIRGTANIASSHRGGVATIGNFDGVHLGHQAVIRQVLERSRAMDAPATVVLFEPQPLEFFRGKAAPPRLMPLSHKLRCLQQLQVDQVLCVRFNAGFSGLSADAFARDVLLDGLAVRHLVVGDDFRFGNDRSGDFTFLQRFGEQHGFGVEDTATHEFDGERVSSTRVRSAVEQGDFTLAQRLLGKPYSLSGRVVHGDKLGRTLGAPTANIALSGSMRKPLFPVALSGVYAVTAHQLDLDRDDEEPAKLGVANVGVRPTVDGSERRFEVHLLDFQGDVYGQRFDVHFHHKIRDEQRFADLDAIKQQIARDVESTRHYFEKQRL